MNIQCVWEHNGPDTLLYCASQPGAFTRGESLDAARAKLPQELASYFRWQGLIPPDSLEFEICQEKESELNIRDADSDVLFDDETRPLTMAEYSQLKELALISARDFQALYDAVPDKDKSCLSPRRCFYGPVPRTAREMYRHTQSVNAYYFAEIDVDADNDGSILSCRERGFEKLEQIPGFLDNPVIHGSYGEDWTLRKVLRRFLWHDRIHARAMYRMAVKTFGPGSVPDVFHFDAP